MTKRKYDVLLKEEVCGKKVRKDLHKPLVSKLRFANNVHHGQARTPNAKVVMPRREANPPSRLITVPCLLDAGVCCVSCAVELI